MSCKFFSISTYGYIRNKCLHYTNELELVLCHPMLYLLHEESHSTLLSITDPLPTSFSYIDFCLVTFPLPLLQSLQNCYRYFCHCYFYFHITLLLNTLLQILSYPGVVELTTQLLILKNIFWLPLCRINNYGLYFTLESCCDPLHLWVITQLCKCAIWKSLYYVWWG